MNYIGKLYAHIGGKKYFDTGKTGKDWNDMEQKIKDLETELNSIKYPFPCLNSKQCETQCDACKFVQKGLANGL